jgi:hypothetical protein
MDGVCGTYGVVKKYKVFLGNLKEKDNLEKPDMLERIILK